MGNPLIEAIRFKKAIGAPTKGFYMPKPVPAPEPKPDLEVSQPDASPKAK